MSGPDSLEKTLMQGGVGGKGWDGWMASPTWWTWVWVNSGSWWWTGRPGVLRFMGSQRVGHDWVTELNWYHRDTDLKLYLCDFTSPLWASAFLLCKMGRIIPPYMLWTWGLITIIIINHNKIIIIIICIYYCYSSSKSLISWYGKQKRLLSPPWAL